MLVVTFASTAADFGCVCSHSSFATVSALTLNFPPGDFVARLMQLPVMPAAKRNSEFIAHLEAYRSRLSKTQVMRITGLPAADQTGL